jgi:hypothetical protein
MIKKIKETDREFELKKLNYVCRGDERLSYINHKYENEYRMDGLLSLISTGALSLGISLLTNSPSDNKMQYELFLLLGIFCFAVNLVISLRSFYLGSQAFNFEIERMDTLEINPKDSIVSAPNIFSETANKWTKYNLIILSLGLVLSFIFIFLNTDLYDKTLKIITCAIPS